MSIPLHVLLLEDRPADAELMVHELRRAGFDPDWKRVDNEADLLANLDPAPDIILSDYFMPPWDGLRALHTLQENGFDIPFIIVSGTVGEDVAVDCMKQGAADYLLKDRLGRLGQAVSKALADRRLREEQKKVENELQKLYTAVEQSGISVVITDLLGNIEYVNPWFTRATGYSADEVIGKNPRVMKSGETPPEVYKQLWDAISAGGEWRGEFHNKKKSGELFWELASITAIRDANGQMTSYLAVKEDITERKRAEAELAASEMRFRRLFEAAQDGILILDASTGQIRHVNPFLLDLLGYSHEELLGKALWEIGLFKDIVASQESFRELQDKGYIRYEDIPLETWDGRRIQVEFVSNVYQVNDEKVIQCNIRDITERKQAELALRKKEAMLAQMGSTAEIGAWELNVETKDLEWTEQVYRIHEVDTDYHPTLREAIAFYAPTSRPIIEQSIQHVIESAEPFDLQLELITAKGNHRWVHARGLTHEQHSKARTVFGTFQDITNRRQMEEALRTSEEHYRMLAENMTDTLWLMDMNLKILYISPSVTRLRGYTLDELNALPLDQQMTPDSFSRVMTLVGELLTPERLAQRDLPIPAMIELEVYKKDGSSFWNEYTMILIRDENGQPVRVLMTGRDISERKQAEKTLKQERKLLRTLIDNMPDIIYAKDVEGRSTLRNPASAQQVGAASADEMLGKTDFDYYPLALAEQYAADDRAVIDFGQPLLNREEQVITADGSEGWILTTKVPLRDTQGTVVGLVGIGRDITERKCSEERVRKLNRTLALLSDVNQAIVRIRSTSALFEEVCRIAVDVGGFRMAWIGLLDHETRWVNPVTSMGLTDGYLEKINIVVDGGLRGQGPTGSAINTGEHGVAEDIEHDSRLVPWREDALKLGYRSSAAFPLKVASQVRGVLTMYADKVNFFDDDELKLLDEMAADISFAMEFAEQETRREQAETALRLHVQAIEEMRLFLQTTLDAFPANTVVLEPDGSIINVNLPWIRFADDNDSPSPMHYLGTNYLTVCDIGAGPSSEEAAPAAAGIRAVIDGSRDEAYLEYPCPSPSEMRWFAMRVTPFPEPAPRRVVIAHINITERKQAEENLRTAYAVLEKRVEERTAELHRAKDHAEAILNNTSEGIVMASVNGHVRQANLAFNHLFDYSVDEVVGQPLTVLVIPDHCLALEATLRDVVDNRHSRWVELTARRDNGSLFDAEIGVSPIVGTGQTLSGLVCTFRDITVRNLVERELQDLNRLKTEFLSTAAHELRTPLTAIRGFSELLLTRELGLDRQKRYMTMINEQSTQLGKLIDDLLDISRMEAKRSLSLQLEPLKLAELLEQAVTLFRESATHHQIRLEGLEAYYPPLVGDAFRLAQVVRNLLSNAVKYAPHGGAITIRYRTLADEVEISVQDQGLGMTPEQQAHLFEKFYRADASNTAITGTGLGLSICKLIVELHGGRIWVESAYGVGTTFYFTLPLTGAAI